MPIPEEHGGSGGSILDCCLVGEALAEGGRDGGLGLSLGARWVIGAVPSGLRGTRETSLGGGTTEIQKMVISRVLPA